MEQMYNMEIGFLPETDKRGCIRIYSREAEADRGSVTRFFAIFLLN